jgi:hypothetical protein
MLEVEQNPVLNPYSLEGMTQMGYMDDITRYEDADVEWLYSHNEVDVGDNETQGLNDPHNGTSATQGKQSKDPATRVLRDREIRTINKYICEQSEDPATRVLRDRKIQTISKYIC